LSSSKYPAFFGSFFIRSTCGVITFFCRIQ
jgi:hypothetical protein